jgi:hypothetical protein
VYQHEYKADKKRKELSTSSSHQSSKEKRRSGERGLKWHVPDISARYRARPAIDLGLHGISTAV